MVLATVVVLGIFVHLSRRGDVLEDVLAEPPAREGAVTPLLMAKTTLPLSRTPVHRAGDVAIRLSVTHGRPVASSITLRVLSGDDRTLASCRYAPGTLADTSVLRCRVRDLALVRRVAIEVAPKSRVIAVVGNAEGVGKLLVPRSRTLAGRLRTVLGRIGAEHPSPFTGWIVPIGTILWLAGLAGVALSIARPRRSAAGDSPERDESDES